jgi:hypothetical protein
MKKAMWVVSASLRVVLCSRTVILALWWFTTWHSLPRGGTRWAGNFIRRLGSLISFPWCLEDTLGIAAHPYREPNHPPHCIQVTQD